VSGRTFKLRQLRYRKPDSEEYPGEVTRLDHLTDHRVSQGKQARHKGQSVPRQQFLVVEED